MIDLKQELIPLQEAFGVGFVLDWVPFGVHVEDPDEGEPGLAKEGDEPNGAMAVE